MPVNKRHDRNSAFGRLYKRLGGNEKIIKALRLLTLEYKVIFFGGVRRQLMHFCTMQLFYNEKEPV
jgi:hypothetical protein